MKSYEKYEKILKEEYPFRIEMHAHTSPASKCADFTPEEVIQKYKNVGYHAVTITNHFLGGYYDLTKQQYLEMFFDNFDRAVKEGEKLSIKVYLAAELRFHKENPFNEYLLYGVTKEDLIECYDKMELSLEEFVKEYKKDYQVIIQAHPYRDNMTPMPSDLLDGYEGFNLHPDYNPRFAFAVKKANESGKINIAGTDFHHLNHEGLAAMRFRVLPEDSVDLAKKLKEKDYIIEIQNKIILP